VQKKTKRQNFSLGRFTAGIADHWAKGREGSWIWMIWPL